MSMPRTLYPTRKVVPFLALFAAAGCSKGSGAPAPSLFSNPGDVELICFDGNIQNEVVKGAVTLPRICCDDPKSLDPESDRFVKACEGTDPLPHALVTQTVRGEVAAVDLKEEKVLDSERRIPGYTFIDVGGQPTAIVSPPSLPCPAGSPAGELCGAPTFSYVAGRDNNEVRAISSCRFRLGRECGPDLENMAHPERRQPVLLVGQPHDMVLDPNGRALWITLPERGLLARVALGTDANTPFALDGTGPDAKPLEPSYFPLAAGVSLTPPEPVAEKDPYYLTCGLGYAYDPAIPPLKLPNAPHADSTRQPHPTRMQLVDVGEGQKLLLVVDDGQAVMHALAITDDEGLEQRALLPVGAPLLDFALTPPVPAQAPKAEDLVGPKRAEGDDTEPAFAYEGPEFTTGTKRYLYAIDARDGSVMAFDFTLNAGVPALQPLLAPTPARDAVRRFGSFGDRLGLGVDNVVARTLTVIDTRERLLETGEKDDHFCAEFSSDTLDDELEAAKLKGTSSPEYLVAKHNRDVHTEAGKSSAGSQLRGVYLMVATTATSNSGLVMVVDVHDLNLQCRAITNCRAGDPDNLSSTSGARGVALRRHAVRLSGIKAASLSISGTDDLETKEFRVPAPSDPDAGTPDVPAEGGADDAGAEEDADEGATCPDHYYRVNDSSLICLVKDPWRARQSSWSAVFRGSVWTGLTSGALVDGEEGADLTLQAPAGIDYCERGAESELFAVEIASKPKKSAATACERPSSEPWRLVVRKAYSDRLLLDLERNDDGEPAIDAKALRECFDDFVSYNLKLAESWRVNSGTYQHNVMRGTDGACIRDESRDARLQSRTDPSQPYQDPTIQFQLREPSEDTLSAKEAINPSVTVSFDHGPIAQSIVSNSSRSDALPVRMRFFPASGHIFVVDAASQGLSVLNTPSLNADTSFH